MKKLKSVLLAMVLVLALVGCGKTTGGITVDRAGNEVTLPSEVNTVVSLAASTTQVLSELGLTEKIVGVDSYSTMYVQDLSEDVLLFDMMAPDFEALIVLQPDLVFVSEMSNAGGEDIFAPIKEAGIAVVTIPTPTTIEGVEEDVQFIADCVNESSEGTKLVEEMNSIVSEISEIAKSITDKKTVAYELSGVPYLYSTGTETYMDEIITTIGAINVYEDQTNWIAVSEEDAVSKNPDVIITSVNYLEDAVGEILSRPGWESVTAVINEDVYYVDNAACTLPNNHVVDALVEFAKLVYPEAYAGLE